MNDAKLIHVVTKRNTERFMLPGVQHHIIPALQRFLSGPGAAPVD